MSGAANDAGAVCRLRDLGGTGAASHKGVIRAACAVALNLDMRGSLPLELR